MIYGKLLLVLENRKNEVLSRSELVALLQHKFRIKPERVIPSNYCYNRTNDGIKFNLHLFHYNSKNEYVYLGQDYPYCGFIYKRKKGTNTDVVVGDWIHGDKVIYNCGYYVYSAEVRRTILNGLAIGNYNLPSTCKTIRMATKK